MTSGTPEEKARMPVSALRSERDDRESIVRVVKCRSAQKAHALWFSATRWTRGKEMGGWSPVVVVGESDDGFGVRVAAVCVDGARETAVVVAAETFGVSGGAKRAARGVERAALVGG